MCFPTFQDRLDISTSAVFLLSFLIHIVISIFNSDLGNHMMLILHMPAFHHRKKTGWGFTLDLHSGSSFQMSLRVLIHLERPF